MFKVAWIIAAILTAVFSTHWYVCKIKNLCEAPTEVAVAQKKPEQKPAPEPKKVTPPPVVKEVPKPQPKPEPKKVTPPPVAKKAEPEVCNDYLTGYLKVGRGANKAADAKKLTQFLNQYEGEKLTVDEVYDAKDKAAVERFQKKYQKEVLAPHDLAAPTGHVLSTTQAQINKLYCAKKK